MKRLYPRQISDVFTLSKLLESYLNELQTGPLQVKIRALCYDSGIPEPILNRLCSLYRNPGDSEVIRPTDYYIVFANLMFRYPTVRFWIDADGEIFIAC